MGSAKEQTPFTIKNLPYGVVSSKDNPAKRCATVLEDHAIDLSVLYTEGVFSAVHGLEQNVFDRVSRLFLSFCWFRMHSRATMSSCIL